MRTAPEVSIVVASVGPSRMAEANLHRFLVEAHGRAEVILMEAGPLRPFRDERLIGPSLKRIPCRAGALAPELWRDGLSLCSADLVAFTTGQMAPRPGWLSAMIHALHVSDAAGVGGPIAPGPSLANVDRALYLLRYANYLPPVPETPNFDPPGDNALYRRDRLRGLESSWKTGFWEVEVHRKLRARGDTLATAPGAVVEFLGGGSLASALSHRLAHARHYGAGRMRGQGLWPRIGRSAAAPAVPPVLLARILKNLRDRGEPLGPWLPALPSLGLLLTTWSFGEAAGGLFGPPARLSA